MQAANSSGRAIWIHALGAKAGGGLTYLEAVLPELVRQLDGKGRRVVLLLPTPPQGITLPSWCEVRLLPAAARNAVTRILFDQVLLPLQLRKQPGAVLFCCGSFPPILKTVPTVVLVRNAIYFDDTFLERERPSIRLTLKLRAHLVRLGARRCVAVHYPTRHMRALVEERAPELVSRGIVNYYGLSDALVEARAAAVESRPRQPSPVTFLYVMTYTLQKNFSFLLKALAMARRARLHIRVVVTSWLENGPPASRAVDRALIETHDLIRSGYLVLAGPKYGSDLVQLYRSVDACLFLSICESFGHPLVEALAIGKPLICADRPYAREICGDRAWYVDPDRPEDLLRLWQTWPAVARDYSPPALDGLVSTFSWPGHVACLLDSLQNQHHS